MRLAYILSLFAAEAAAAPSFIDRLAQKPLLDSFPRARSLLEKVGELSGDSLDGVDDQTKHIWHELEESYPDLAARMSFKSKCDAKIGKRADTFWDSSVTDDKLGSYKLRVKKHDPKELEIDTVDQYSGYLDDLKDDKHWFYWFFESRNNPRTDPIILWLSGGPGCSSLTSLLFELGPAFIDESLKPVYNPFSWNANASVIFLDQPVNVGYSYSSKPISSSVSAGKDVYAFLELFFKKFPEYLNNPFHLASESYGGHYIPAFTTEIMSHDDRSFNLTSVLIGNGLTDPLLQYPEFYNMACTNKGGVDPVLSKESCANMSSTLPMCLSLIEGCYESQSVISCFPATVYCNNGQLVPYQKTGRNVYDVRKMCEGETLCYTGFDYVTEYLNLDYVKKVVGAEVDHFQACNWDLFNNFLFAGDWMKPFHKYVADILAKHIPILLYAGDKDFICNWLGNHVWSDALPWSGHASFENATMLPMVDDSGIEIGLVKNSGNLTFAKMFGGGHFFPHDQPEAALTMLNRWTAGNLALL